MAAATAAIRTRQSGSTSFSARGDQARALDCAVAIRAIASEDGVPLRIGVHVGEVELTAKGARGVAVHEAARITAAAQPGEIWVSDTTRALAAGSGITFEDRGEHELKGIERTRKLFALSAGGDPASA